ncbi:hypothetical protein B0H13DRAFT_1883175 [Mycena leptocephala]|nr:hypothetical protein B0H13DRAFT_1883175 [Mycena leptocephala]
MHCLRAIRKSLFVRTKLINCQQHGEFRTSRPLPPCRPLLASFIRLGQLPLCLLSRPVTLCDDLRLPTYTSYPASRRSTGDALGDSSESTPAANGLVGYPNGRSLPTGTHKGSRPGDHRKLSKGCLECPERRRRLERQDPACIWSRLSGWDPRKSDPPPTRLSTSYSTATGARIVISSVGVHTAPDYHHLPDFANFRPFGFDLAFTTSLRRRGMGRQCGVEAVLGPFLCRRRVPAQGWPPRAALSSRAGLLVNASARSIPKHIKQPSFFLFVVVCTTIHFVFGFTPQLKSFGAFSPWREEARGCAGVLTLDGFNFKLTKRLWNFASTGRAHQELEAVTNGGLAVLSWAIETWDQSQLMLCALSGPSCRMPSENTHMPTDGYIVI